MHAQFGNRCHTIAHTLLCLAPSLFGGNARTPSLGRAHVRTRAHTRFAVDSGGETRWRRQQWNPRRTPAARGGHGHRGMCCLRRWIASASSYGTRRSNRPAAGRVKPQTISAPGARAASGRGNRISAAGIAPTTGKRCRPPQQRRDFTEKRVGPGGTAANRMSLLAQDALPPGWLESARPQNNSVGTTVLGHGSITTGCSLPVLLLREREPVHFFLLHGVWTRRNLKGIVRVSHTEQNPENVLGRTCLRCGCGAHTCMNEC